MSLEDELRETMRAHDTDAPTAEDLPPLPGRRRMLLPLIAAAAVLVVAGGIFAITESRSNSHHRTTAATATCPAKYQNNPGTAFGKPWVPAEPSGIDANARLVPDATPESALVCAYLGTQKGDLTGSRDISAGLSDLQATLTWATRGSADGPCAAYLAITDGDNYLLSLTYPGGRAWISLPGNHCAGASNGRFVTPMNFSSQAAAAFRTGQFPESPDNRKVPQCPLSQHGRLGQDAAMVPGEPTRLRVCSQTTLAYSTQVAADVRAIAELLNQPPTKASTQSCQPVSANGVTFYEFDFGYDIGPDVWVRVATDCPPAIDNNSLSSDSITIARQALRRVGLN